MEIMAPRGLASIKLHALMARAILSNVRMTVHAHVDGLTHAHGGNELWSMLNVTRHTLTRIQVVEQLCVSRVSELGTRMRILRIIKFIPMTVHTRVLQDDFRIKSVGMTHRALHLNLMVSMGGLSWQKQGFLLRYKQLSSQIHTAPYW